MNLNIKKNANGPYEAYCLDSSLDAVPFGITWFIRRKHIQKE